MFGLLPPDQPAALAHGYVIRVWVVVRAVAGLAQQ